jgi:hypothetical protein
VSLERLNNEAGSSALKNKLAGEIREAEEAFIFQYNTEYLATADSKITQNK